MSRTTYTCPGCERDDRVQAVPAVYLAGRDAVTSRERNRDGDMRTVTRTVTTGLSDALAPVPEAPSYAIGGLGVLAGAVAVGTFLGGVLAGKWFSGESAHEPPELDGWHLLPQDVPVEPPPAYEFLGWISALALLAAVLVLVVVLRRRAAFAHLTRGRHRAEELWSCGWYCHRCGTVHFEDVPGEDRTPLTLQRFRERVWEHGGYGDLAAEQRAVDSDRS
ncbi:hypothetical protein AQF52_3490 [Streptomyces venezuelae]|uniref:hypothetical protein n=1 Tax=Streptomyces gardneri TaxID=66892 RepID=UPI0006BD89AE|nr:hypothetical protein [Streptomyces gardneri]ALO09084.1 hypothetical protein AQF52_3490 [Streptomyces venezuelae]QPK46226.1 hypothetical protein H4W23_17375 [Streptomyces gardneri]WRK37597.1 hypothetical protein U0M97_17460 [Streptomyces venezuelae]CUM40518.1 hypothetical protein BN2537_10001 [Streptomyces venezuelae]